MSVGRKTLRLAVPCVALAGFVLALAIGQWPKLVKREAMSSLPALQGAAAVEHLRQTGLYDSLAAAMTATRYGVKPVPVAQSSRLAWDKLATCPTEAQPNSQFVANNPAQQLRAGFASAGIELSSTALATMQSGGWRLGMKLRGAGYGDGQSAAGEGALTAQDNRVEYTRPLGTEESAITEWYVNAPTGVEQGFTLASPPGGPPDGRQQGEPLRLTLSLEGELRARAEDDGQAVAFTDAAGNGVLRYDHLAAWDACGQPLAARMSVTGDELRLEVEDAAAVYPVTIDPNFTQQAYLKASNTQANDVFGFAVAVSGDTVVVGAAGEDSNATGVNGDQINNSASGSGAVYVFVRSGTTWSQQAYLKASNTGAFDGFGGAVAVSGDTVVVGANQEDSNATGVNGNQADNSAQSAGAAYIFVRSGTTWSQQAYLKASNTGALDAFGQSVAVSGDTVVVGTEDEDSNATGVNGDGTNNSADSAGAAYVFVRSGTIWSQQAYLKASNTEASDSFGESVGVSGDTVVVGARVEASNATGVNGNQADNSASQSGAAYVFVRSGTTWSQQAYLKASNTGAGDFFGLSVAVSGDTVVVGALVEDSNATGVNGNQADNSADSAGAAYVFVRNGMTWTQQAYLKASNTGAFDFFGRSVAVSGDTVVVGANGEDSNATGVNGNQADNSASSSGAAYVFVRSGTTWSQQAYLKASNTGANDVFGFSVAISGDTVVIGAFGEESNATGVNGDQADNSALTTGATYVFFAPPIVVTTLADEQNTNGQCSLREALINANNDNQSGSADCAAGSGTDTISFSVNGTINLGSSLPDISSSLTITGPGANLLTVRRNVAGLFRIFTINAGSTVNLSGLTISNGDLGAGNDGGGVLNAGTLTISNCAITGNHANGAGGVLNSGILTMTGSTLSGNTANFDGGGLYNSGNATAMLTNCTISGNAGTSSGIMTAASSGQTATTTLTNCTVTANLGNAPTIKSFNFGGATAVTTQLKNTLVAANGGVNFSIPSGTTLTSQGNNLDSDGTSGFTNGVSGNLVGTAGTPLNAQLGALANNGGMTQTHALNAGSPAINAGSNTGAPATDQRGISRPQGAAVDIGAFEVTANPLLVTNTNDAGAGSLRQAIATANGNGTGLDDIIFDNTVFNTAKTITLTSGELAISNNLTINGPGANLLTVSGANLSRIFNISAGAASVSIAGMTMRDGRPVGGAGGGAILINNGAASGPVNITDCLITNNDVTAASNPLGGGIDNEGGTVTITRSTISNNVASFRGGGLQNQGFGSMTIINSTISGNTAGTTGIGGAIRSLATLTLTSCTVFGNSAQTGGNISRGSGTLSFGNTIIAGGTLLAGGGTAPDVDGTLTSLDYNLIQNTTGATISGTTTHDITGVSPQLGPLGSYGGPTPTHLLLASSPARNAGNNTGAPATDQRGFARPVGATVDIGAVENDVTLTITPATLPNGQIAQPYSQQLSQTGGATGTITWTVSSGTLPGNVSLNSSTGLLSGAPTGSGTFNFTVTITSQNGLAGVKAYTLIISACPMITVTPASLPAGASFTFYSQTISAGGGALPYSFSISAGALPAGLTLTTGGLLSGVPTVSGPFNFTVRATDTNLCTGQTAYTLTIAANPGLQFYPLPSPVRLLDTRSSATVGCVKNTGPFVNNEVRTQAARTACSTIPANATAIIGNITVVPSGPGFLTLFPSDATQPTVANSNFKAGEVTNNFFTVGLGATGLDAGAFKIFTSLFTGGTNSEVIIDVTGYYAPPGAGGLYYHPLPAPVRLVQTFPGGTGCFLNGSQQLQGTNNPNANPALDLVVDGRGAGLPSPCNGIPGDAVVLVGNATTVFPAGLGYLTIYPSDATRPTVASSNYAGGDIINGPFAVKLGADGRFKVYTFSTTHLVIDISGYYSASPTDANGAGLLFNPLPKPMRLLETRNIPGLTLTGCYKPQAPIPGGTGGIRTQQVWGMCSDQPITIPNTSRAIVGNVTVINPEGAGFGTFFPGNVGTAPTVATTNYPFPVTFGYNRHYYVGLSPSDGTFKILTQFTSNYIVDVSGYFAP